MFDTHNKDYDLLCDGSSGSSCKLTLGRFILGMIIIVAVYGYDAYRHHHPNADLLPSGGFFSADSGGGNVHENAFTNE